MQDLDPPCAGARTIGPFRDTRINMRELALRPRRCAGLRAARQSAADSEAALVALDALDLSALALQCGDGSDFVFLGHVQGQIDVERLIPLEWDRRSRKLGVASSSFQEIPDEGFWPSRLSVPLRSGGVSLTADTSAIAAVRRDALQRSDRAAETG